ncbi:MAG: phage major capsid protein [Elusimicrobiota bacterium]|jgi:HK97 family phage major capsid protein|nr:phage major capsid protein [Elusimicrobiota bacterium]
MDEITTSIKELRKNLDSKLNSCITKEKAEKIIEDIITKLHPAAESKAVLPASQSDVPERLARFRAKGSAAPETPWTTAYGRKFGGMRNFLLAAKNKHSALNDFKSVLSETGANNAGGGYLVPTEFSAEVMRIMNEASPIMQIANIIPMSSWKRQIPKQLSNLQVGWVAENGIKGISNPVFGQIEQTAKVLATVIKCTDELIRDSAINLTAFLSELVAEAMALEIERVALLGNGEPFTGILNTAGVNAVQTAAAEVNFDDIANLIFSLKEADARQGVIVLSRAGLNKLMKLKDSNGNYIWSPPSLGSPATIWNTPYVVSSQIPSAVTDAGNLTGGDKTIAFFGRFNKNLLISPREDMTLKVSQDAAAWNTEGSSLESAFMMDQTWLRFTQALSVDVTFGNAFSYLIFK